MKKKYMNVLVTLFSQRILLLYVLFLFTGMKSVKAQTTLVAGDIAVLGLNGDDTFPNQRWAFVPLVDLATGTVIHFTDAGYDASISSGNKFFANGLNEGHMTWTVPASITAGTILLVTNNSGSGNATIKDIANASYAGVIGSVGGSNNGFNAGGDQIIVFQGSAGTTVGATFLYAFNNGQHTTQYTGNGVWISSGNIVGQQMSYLPPGLTNGATALALTSNNLNGVTVGGIPYGYDNMRYKPTALKSGTRSQLLAAISNGINWEGDNDNGYNFDAIGDFTVLSPTITSATYNANTGVLVVTGTNFLATSGANNDVIANKFTFTGETGSTYTLTDTDNVEITGATSFTLTLSATDRAAVNVILNKNGISSIGGLAYNLSGAAGFIAASPATADISGNGITVSNVSDPATVTTTTASAITATSATLGGNVTADGGATVTERGIVWATTANPTTSDNKITISDGTGAFSQTIGLPAEQTIYVRAYAINSEGTAYGNEESFTTSAATAPGNALRFDGTNYVSAPAATQISFIGTDNFSIEAWVKPDNSSGLQTIVAKSSNGNGQLQYWLFLNGGTVNFGLDNINGGGWAWFDSGITLPLSKWSHVAVTKSGSTVLFYINGTLAATINATNTSYVSAMASTGPLLIGGGFGGHSFRGELDEVRVWNSVRSAADIAGNWLDTVDPTSSSLVAYYRFDQGIAGGTNTALHTVYDQTANGNHGTLNNFTLSGTTSNWVISNAMVAPIAPDGNGILYVKKGGAGSKSGNDWGNAVGELAEALKAAKTNTAIKEIWVSGGTYKPLYSAEDGVNFGTDQGRDNTFLMVNNVKIYGGFAGTEDGFSDRDLSITANASILSGDIDNNDPSDGTIVGNNVYHVVVSSGSVGTAVLDGFTITGGYAQDSGNILINGNTVDKNDGGGIAVIQDSDPVLSNLHITRNSAAYGSGIYNFSSSPLISHTRISYNSGGVWGGAISNIRSSPKIVNSLIHHNSVSFRGGAIYNMYAESAPELVNVTIVENTAGTSGAAIDNDASNGVKIHNSIIWGNTNGGIGGNPSIVSNSIVQGGYAGTQVLNADPQFTNSTAGDYTLLITSPAVNKGNNGLFTGLDANTKDLAGDDRVYKYSDGGVIDMGAYELQADVIPQITSTPSLTIPYGQFYNYSITATGNDAVPTTLSAEVLPDWLNFSADAESQATTFGAVPPDKIIKGVAGDDQGNTYAITPYGTEIYKIAPDGTTTLWKSSPYGGDIFALHITDGYLYIPRLGNSSYSISRISLADPNSLEEKFVDNATGAVSVTDHGDWIYVADYDGHNIYRVHKTTQVKENIMTGLSPSPYGLTFGADDNLYVAMGQSIMRYDGTALTPVLTGLPANATSIRQDKQGNFYVSMSGGGVRKYKTDFTSFVSVSETVNDNVVSLSLTPSGYLVYSIYGTNQIYRLQTGPLLSGTPDKSKLGDHPVTIRATNVIGHTEQTFTITVVDETAPVISSLTPAAGAPAVELQPTLSVTFDEEIELGTTGTLQLMDGATVLKTYDLSVTGDRAAFTLSADRKALSWAVDEDLPLNTNISVEISSGFVKDEAGNDFAGITGASGAWNFTTRDRTMVTSVAVPANATYRIGQELTFTVNYAEAITVDETNGKPSLPLTIGTAGRQAAYSDGSGTTALTFSYTVQSGDLDGDGIVLGTDIVLNGGDMGLASTVLNNVSNTTSVLVDGVAPAAPSVPDLSPASDSGSSNTDNLTNDTTPTVTGTAEAGSTVTLYDTDGTTVLGTAVATGGNWSITSSTLSEGTHSLTAKATDAAGNVGPASAALVITIDVTAPAAPTGLTAAFGNQQNVLNWTANGETDIASYKVYGGTSANPTTLLGTVPAPAITYTHTGLTNGTTYYYRIAAVDQAGNESAKSAEDSAVPKAPQVITFGALPAKVYGDADFAPGATSTNNSIAITYSSSNESVATIVAGKIHIVGAGTTTITASQAGNTSFTPAPDVPQTLTVNPKALTVTAKDRSKTYGSTLTLGTTEFTTDGLVNGNTVTSVTLTSAGAAATATVDTYDIEATAAQGTGLSNYTISYVKGTLTVNPKALTVTANNRSKTYGSTLTLGTTEFTASGLVNGNTVTSVTLTSAGAAATATVGTYDIEATAAQGTGLSNYTISYVNGTLTVNPKALTVTANDRSKTYGSTLTLGTTEFTASGLVNGNTVTSVTLTSAGAAATATVDTYDIEATAAQGTGLSNYTISYVKGTLTVTPKALTITADDRSKTYGSTLTLGTTEFTTDGLVNGNTVTSVTLTSDGAAATAIVGTYDITATAAQGTGLSNYTISYVKGTLTVSPKALTITANDRSKTYGTELGLGTSEFTPVGLVNGDAVTSVTLSSAGAAATAAVTTYDITASAAQGPKLTNYEITYVKGTLTVNKKALTITANDRMKIYGETLALGTTEFTPSGLVNGDEVTSVTLASDGAVATAAVTTYDITASAAQGPKLTNYEITYTKGTLTVNKKALTITANDRSKTYGTELTLGTAEFTPAGLVNGDEVTSVILASDGTVATAAVTTYDITASAAQGPKLANYEITYVKGTLMVNKKALTITANDRTKIYGEALTLGSTEFTPSGLVNGDEVTSVTLASDGTVATAAVNSYDITASAAQGPKLSNYEITYVKGTLTVNKKALTITANNRSKTYGTELTLGTAEFTPVGLVNGDAVTSVTLASAGAVATAAVTTYDITASAAQGPKLSNYEISYAKGTLTVNKKALTITANNRSKTYGETLNLGTTEFTPTGLMNGDAVTSVTLSSAGAVATAAVTTYDITASAALGPKLSNYDITYTKGTLTVNKKALTITANNRSKTYGETLNLGTAEFTPVGLVNGDAVTSVTLSSDGAAATAAVTTYDITASAAQGPKLSNYDITYAKGTLTVNKKALTITANNRTKIYGETLNLGTAEFTPTGLVNGDAVTSVSLSSSGSAATADVNTYDITASSAQGPKLGNYDITYVKGTLTVNKSPQTISFVSPGTLTRDAGTIDLDVEASSGLPVALTIDDEIIATVNSTALTMTVKRLGTVILTATQEGNHNYLPAEPVSVTVRIANDANARLPIRVHQAVSPNGDGINEFLQLEGIRDYPENKVTIFDKSGKVLAEIESYDNRDNVFTGQTVRDGIYYYYLDIKDGGEWKREKGYFVVRRSY